MPLTAQQQTLKRKVIDYGKRNGYSHADIQLAVNDIVFGGSGNDTLNGEGLAMPPL